MGSMRHCRCERDPAALSPILTGLMLGLRSRSGAFYNHRLFEFGVVDTMGSHYCVQDVWTK